MNVYAVWLATKRFLSLTLFRSTFIFYFFFCFLSFSFFSDYFSACDCLAFLFEFVLTFRWCTIRYHETLVFPCCSFFFYLFFFLFFSLWICHSMAAILNFSHSLERKSNFSTLFNAYISTYKKEGGLNRKLYTQIKKKILYAFNPTEVSIKSSRFRWIFFSWRKKKHSSTIKKKSSGTRWVKKKSFFQSVFSFFFKHVQSYSSCCHKKKRTKTLRLTFFTLSFKLNVLSNWYWKEQSFNHLKTKFLFEFSRKYDQRIKIQIFNNHCLPY